MTGGWFENLEKELARDKTKSKVSQSFRVDRELWQEFKAWCNESKTSHSKALEVLLKIFMDDVKKSKEILP